MSGPSRPLISLIIPTRERADTLCYALETALSQKTERLEIIVSDNFSSDNTREVVELFSDPRIKYLNTSRRVSMSDNWEFALNHATGQYVIFIGDDDAVMPCGIDELQGFMQRWPSQVYRWPKHFYEWPNNGCGAYVSFLAPSYPPREFELAGRARFVVSMGGWRYEILPSLYHSAVSREIIDKMRERTGRVFHATQPDIFTCMTIPVFARSAVDTGHSITCHGHSPKSNSGGGLTQCHIDNHKRFIEEYGNYKIHPSLFPEINMLSNLTPDSVLVAMDKYPEFYQKMRFNYEAMWALLWREGRSYGLGMNRWDILRRRNEIRRHHSFHIIRFLCHAAIHEAAARRKQLLAKLKRPTGPSREIPGNIRDFVRQLVQMERARTDHPL